MAIDERNFRSAYYEKVGFTNVEEKKSLDILLKEKPLNFSKLKQFCLRFIVPGAHRNLVWKLLLGVIPVQEQCREFVVSQRQQEYSNLLHALHVMKVSQNMTKDNVFISMWLLQNGKLQFTTKYETQEWLRPVCLIVRSMLFQFEQNEDMDVYWLIRTFYESVQKFQCEVPKLIEATHNLLEKEDFQLYEHLNKNEILKNLPFEQWYECCFAGIIHDAFLGRIWDKIAAGSYKVLAYTATITLISLKDQIINCNNLKDVMLKIENISGKLPELIVTKTLKLWQQQGSPMTVYDKPKP